MRADFSLMVELHCPLCLGSHVYTCTHTYTDVHTCSYMFTYVHTCSRVHTHVYIHVHTHSCPRSRPGRAMAGAGVPAWALTSGPAVTGPSGVLVALETRRACGRRRENGGTAPSPGSGGAGRSGGGGERREGAESSGGNRGSRIGAGHEEQARGPPGPPAPPGALSHPCPQGALPARPPRGRSVRGRGIGGTTWRNRAASAASCSRSGSELRAAAGENGPAATRSGVRAVGSREARGAEPVRCGAAGRRGRAWCRPQRCPHRGLGCPPQPMCAGGGREGPLRLCQRGFRLDSRRRFYPWRAVGR